MQISRLFACTLSLAAAPLAAAGESAFLFDKVDGCMEGPLRRITFFPPDENGWNWKLEFSSDGGETWTEVYRIKATPWQEEAD